MSEEPEKPRMHPITAVLLGVFTCSGLGFLFWIGVYLTAQGLPEVDRAQVVVAVIWAVTGLLLSAAVGARSMEGQNPLTLVSQLVNSLRGLIR